ncbi:MAG: hypothetical protein KJ607_02190 [Bacteroidetes bacterium]|nr:hypothetical protein [Bacteroidota bacterium]
MIYLQFFIALTVFIPFYALCQEKEYDNFEEERAERQRQQEEVYKIYRYGMDNKQSLTLASAVEMAKLYSVEIEGIDLEEVLVQAEKFADNDKNILDIVNGVRMMKGRGKIVSTGINYNRAFKSTIAKDGIIERTYTFEAGAPAEVKVIDDIGQGVDIEVFDVNNNPVKIERVKNCKSYTYVSWTPIRKESYRIVVKNTKSPSDIKVLFVTN